VKGLRTIEILASVEVVCESSFSYCRSLTPGTFDLNPKLQLIAESAFEWSGWQTIRIPVSVEVVGNSTVRKTDHLYLFHFN
jgi:hypothetical protein